MRQSDSCDRRVCSAAGASTETVFLRQKARELEGSSVLSHHADPRTFFSLLDRIGVNAPAHARTLRQRAREVSALEKAVRASA